MPKGQTQSFPAWVDAFLLAEAFAFGESFDALFRLSSGMDVKGYGGVVNTIEDLGRNWDTLTMTIGSDDFDDLQWKCNSMRKYLLKKYKRRRHLTQADVDKIGKEFAGDRERYLLKLYAVTVIPEVSLKILNANTLESGPKGFFKPEIWGSLPPGIKGSLSSSTVCLLVGEWTPSVMVGLRACEEAVREYYRFKTRMQVKGFKPWKDLINELINRDDVSKSLLGHLDFIREKRNEAEHPGTNFTRDEAETTFIQVTSTVADVYKELDDSTGKKRTRKSHDHSGMT